MIRIGPTAAPCVNPKCLTTGGLIPHNRSLPARIKGLCWNCYHRNRDNLCRGDGPISRAELVAGITAAMEAKRREIFGTDNEQSADYRQKGEAA